MSLAPRRTARFTSSPMMGWAHVVFVPMARMHFELARSEMGLVIAPLPKLVARPATVGECQRRAQWSTLLVPIPTRASFCMA